jgi:antitoxin component of MazEF toxin-antitoxin module
MEKVFVNLQRYGNTSAATIPIAMAEAAAQGRLRRGDKVLIELPPEACAVLRDDMDTSATLAAPVGATA